MDPGDLLRAVRRERRLSQRELALLAGVAKSTIDRIEARPEAQPSFRLMVRVLDAAGYEVLLLHETDPPLSLYDGRDGLIDRGGRRFPAHLPIWEVPPMFGPPAHSVRWWGWHHRAFYDGDPNTPEWTFARRPHLWPWGVGDWIWSDAT